MPSFLHVPVEDEDTIKYVYPMQTDESLADSYGYENERFYRYHRITELTISYVCGKIDVIGCRFENDIGFECYMRQTRFGYLSVTSREDFEAQKNQVSAILKKIHKMKHKSIVKSAAKI